MPITTGVILEHNTLFTVTFYANITNGVILEHNTLFTVTFYVKNYWRKFGAQHVFYCDILRQ
jgi:hypothetical protein